MTATIETPALFDVPAAPAPAPKRRKPYATREEWLVAATRALAPLFAGVGETVPAVRVSVGWPGGRGAKNTVIGQAWHKAASADGVAQVFVSPVLDDPVRVLDVLIHELIHVIDENQSGHRGRFAKIAKAVGLEGKMTATVAGEALRETLAGVVDLLGPYPHARLKAPAVGEGGADGPKKQGTRMLKVECAAGSGYIVRMTRKWLDEVGAPICPCHGEPMREA